MTAIHGFLDVYDEQLSLQDKKFLEDVQSVYKRWAKSFYELDGSI